MVGGAGSSAAAGGNAGLNDSTRTHRTTQGDGSICNDRTLESDLTSDISSSSSNAGSIADYEIHGLIGRGKYSQVYSAMHLPTQTAVAIKKVAIFDMMDHQTRSDCLREVKILQSLEHPNIVKCYNSFIQDNEMVIVLEWAKCGDLAQVLRERLQQGFPFSPAEVLTLFGEVCHAVKHMHDRRMMHRDLKPGNIFVADDGCLKLGDLGLSRYFSSRTLQAVSTVGTPYYMSPECIKGQPYDFSSDMWSLGCLLYELVTLRNPFFKEGQSLYALGKSINACSFEPLPVEVPAPLRDMVTAMLQPNAQARPTITQVVNFIAEAAAGTAAQSQQLGRG